MRSSRAIADKIADTLEPFLPTRYEDGNRIRVLGSARQYFPGLLEAIAQARHSIHLETYIFADDPVGREVLDALVAAARRGVDVRMLIDGFGSGEYSRRLRERFAREGQPQLRIFRPERWWRPQPSLFRRLHRKIVVIDDRLAFVGGINVEADPTEDEITGEAIGPRFDVSVCCEGPIVAPIAFAVRRLWWAVGVANLGRVGDPAPVRQRPDPPFADGVRAALVLRDNLRHRHSIERSYLGAIRAARNQILVACAYFLPGRRFRGALLRAAQRGVRVRLLLQGRMQYRLQHHAQRALYGQLLDAGIEIHEYQRSYLHAKVAVIDEDWATVGSSNIDPFSLLMAREANVVVRDRDFSSQLRALIEVALATDARQLRPGDFARRAWWERVTDWVAYGLVRTATILLARARSY